MGTQSPLEGVPIMQVQLFLLRGFAAIAWAVAFATVSDELMTETRVLLVIYPLIDMVASGIDARSQHGSTRRLLLLNVGISAAAAIALGIASTGEIGDVLVAFGAWAIVSGARQFGVAVRRRVLFGKQLPLLLAGGLSVVAGTVLIASSAGDEPSFNWLISYAAFGGLYFVIESGLLARRLHRSAGVSEDDVTRIASASFEDAPH